MFNVEVYFQDTKNSYCERVALFDSEELYMACLPALKKTAKEKGFIVTENINFNEVSFAKDVLSKNNIIGILWGKEDLIGFAKERDIVLTEGVAIWKT